MANPRVWLSPVNSPYGKQEPGFIAVSREYLVQAVYAKISMDPAIKFMREGAGWLEGRLPVEIEAVLNQHKARPGYATLAGAARPVWVLRRSQIKLENGKTLRSESVDVVEGI